MPLDPAPPDDREVVSPEAAGLDPGLGAQLDAAVQDGRLPGLHAVLVARGGRLAVERYYAGRDWAWGRPLGDVVFGPEVRHDLRSVTKSVVGLLYGLALEDGAVPPPDAPLVEQFPDYPDLARDPGRRRITIGHALSMRLGLAWDETLPYSDARNSEIAMERAADRYRFVLEQPVVTPAGERWTYNGGATALLAKLVAHGSGMRLLDYARERLFGPLGIADVEWIEGADGEPSAASGLRMRGRDLLKIGQLVLNRGGWEGRQVVPAAWLDESFAVHARRDDGMEYGYHWWLRPPGVQARWIFAFGNGGQRLAILPGRDLVIAVLAGNYNRADAWQVPVAVTVDFVLPALRPEA